MVHIKSGKHKKNVASYMERERKKSEVTDFITDYFVSHPEEMGSCMAPETLHFRWFVVEAFLHGGIPLTKVDELRKVFELAGHPLTDSSHLKEFIPKILHREVAQVKEELDGLHFTISFDGTTRLGEAVNLVARFVPYDFKFIGNRLAGLGDDCNPHGRRCTLPSDMQHHHEETRYGYGVRCWHLQRQLCNERCGL
eukprot:scaffold268518_cov32-Tisochrysis_lutea.AAC.1